MDYTKYKNVKILKHINNEIALVECKGYKFHIRKEKIDAFTVDEVFKVGYFKNLELNKNDIVIDIGLNIGVFSVAASKLCKKVIAYEPDRENFELAKKNLALNNINNVEIYQKAIAKDKGKIDLYLNSGVCSDCHSTLKIRGREHIQVISESINDVLEKYNPTKLKIDCEGEELNFMGNAKLCNVKNIAMEVHFTYSKRDKHMKYYRMIKNLEKYFLNIKYPKVQNNFSRMLFANNAKSEYKKFEI